MLEIMVFAVVFVVAQTVAGLIIMNYVMSERYLKKAYAKAFKMVGEIAEMEYAVAEEKEEA